MDFIEQTIARIEPSADAVLAAEIQGHLDQLTKPRGSLGRLEQIALQYGLARGTAELHSPRKALFVFCADHGVAEAGVSAYPREVTQQMVRNFVSGGAAINVLCRQYDIDPFVVDMGVDADLGELKAVISRKVARGTRNFASGPAMTRAEAEHAVGHGIRLARAASLMKYGLAGIGEMGIANTTSAAAMLAAFAGCDPDGLTGSGTGIDEAQRLHKADVIRQALELHKPDQADPLGVLAAVGGFEIAGMAGFLLGAAAERLPVAVDGFIASAAALVAVRLAPMCSDYLIFSHQSSEPGHAVMLDLIGACPLLKLDLRLGEGSGAALAINLVDTSLRLYREMATFDSARVSDRGKAES
jgi:nicotinate-nucleotide--dimethylbenzimidazole phosphoribosyltransferase